MLPRIAYLTAVALLIAISLRPTFAPAPRPPVSPADFSTDNALAHVRAIATEPHPIGSAANSRVRDYIVGQLNQLGLDATVQSESILDRYGHPITVQNVLARIRAPQSAIGTSQPAILLVAHYDSVSRGPGAGDDAAAVAAIIETCRALRAASPPLKQDVRILITDGEEPGLYGARAFVAAATPAELASISLVLNFDARGTAGPSIMYEAAPGSLALIDHFAAADPYPIGNSLAYDVSKRLPNGSDFMAFRPAGLKGLNFALIGNYFYYHTANDTPANLDPASLNHHGQHMISLARHFAGLSTAEVAAITAENQPGAVYFNLTPSILIRYSAAWIWPLTVLLLVVAVAALTIAIRRRVVTLRGLLGASLRFLLAAIVAPLAVWGLTLILRPPTTPTAFTLQLLAAVAVTVIITAAIALEFRRHATLPDLAAVGVVLFCLLAILVNLSLPGGSFLFTWPPLFVALGLLAAALTPQRQWLRSLIAIIAVAPAALLLPPLITQLFTALTLALAQYCAIGVVLATWLILGAAAPLGRTRETFQPPRASESETDVEGTPQ